MRCKFFAGCPACGKSKRILWNHCSSYEEIDEDGWIYCLGCRKYIGFIMDIRYKCEFHDYRKPTDVTAVFQALAMMTDDQKDIPTDFAIKLSKKILERLS
jgi:hypothetical protein